MAMVDVVSQEPTGGRPYGWSPSAWSKGRQPSGAVLHSSRELGDSTINIVLVIVLLLLLFWSECVLFWR